MRKKINYKILIPFIVFVVSLLFASNVIKKINYGLDFKGGFEVLYEVKPLDNETLSENMIKSTYKAIVNRIDTLGVSEPEILIEGNNIRVRLPGVKNEEEARKRLSTPAVLTFRNILDEKLMDSNVLGTPGASLDYDPNTNLPVVALNIKDNDTFYKVTKSISESDNNSIVIWLDFEEGVNSFATEKEKCGQDGNLNCISYAVVNEGFRDNVVIQGNFTEKEANMLVDLINSGSLPTKLEEISTKTVSPSLGDNTINKVLLSFVISIILITLFLLFKYKICGLITSICLFIYSITVLYIYNNIGGVLTLSGVSAMILGIGMAVDSNIISFERIKDEIRNKKNIKVAFKEGNKRSLISIIDANITTFLAALILFIFGESSVKGFATMLMITILVTILIMVYLNRYFIKEFLSIRYKKENIFLGKIEKISNINFIKNCKYIFIVFVLFFASSIVSLAFNNVNLGIDFSGGSLVNVRSEELTEKKVSDILNNYNIKNMEKISDSEINYTVKTSLKKDDINLIKKELNEYDVNITSISNIVKQELTKNALTSLLLASLIIIIYVAVRFSFNFGVSAILTLVFDLIVVVSFFILFNIEINFIFIASLLTIVGYSINDTIVIFDRIRENKKLIYKDNIKNKNKLKDLINLSCSQTLTRNIWTSITTIITLLVLMFMGIKEIETFNIAILIGLISGSFSSLFVAPYLYYLLEKNNLNNKDKKKKYEDELDEKIIIGING